MAGVPGQRGRAVPQGLDRRRPAAAHRERLTTPLVRDRATGELRAGPWDEALDLVADRLARCAGGARAGRGRGVRRRRADQREGLPARQVRPGRARHQPDRLQRPLVHVVGGVGRQPGVRDRPRAAVPAGRRRADRRAGARRVQPRRDHAAGRPAPRPAARARRPGRRRSTRGARRPPTAPTCSSSRCPAPTSPLALGAAAPARSPPARSTTAYVAAAHHRLGRRTRARSPRGGPSGSSGSPACPVAELRALAGCSPGGPRHGAHRARRRAARQGTDTVLAWINVALALGHARHAARRLRLPHRPGQRPGRPRARAEGRPAARLPDDRRPGGARARRRRVGRRPRSAARHGALGVRAARRARHADGPAALLVFGSNIVVSAPNATHVDRAAGGARPARRRRHRDVARPRRWPTSCCR